MEYNVGVIGAATVPTGNATITAVATVTRKETRVSRVDLANPRLFACTALEVRFACIRVKQVYVISIDMQPDTTTRMGLRTWIEAGNNLFSANHHINQQFISQVFHNIYRSLDPRTSLSIR